MNGEGTGPLIPLKLAFKIQKKFLGLRLNTPSMGATCVNHGVQLLLLPTALSCLRKISSKSLGSDLG